MEHRINMPRGRSRSPGRGRSRSPGRSSVPAPAPSPTDALQKRFAELGLKEFDLKPQSQLSADQIAGVMDLFAYLGNLPHRRSDPKSTEDALRSIELARMHLHTLLDAAADRARAHASSTQAPRERRVI